MITFTLWILNVHTWKIMNDTRVCMENKYMEKKNEAICAIIEFVTLHSITVIVNTLKNYQI